MPAARRRTKGDGGLFKRADGTWIGVVELPLGADGKRRRKRVASRDRNEAIRKLKKLRSDVEAGALPTAPTTTVGKWLDHWLDTIAKPNLRGTTYRNYEQVIRLYIKPNIGAARLDRLKADDIRTMYRTIQERSPRFALLAHQVLSPSLKQAAAEGLLLRNPMLTIQPPKYVPGTRSAFSAEVAGHILTTAFRHGDELGVRWATAFLTGARRGELLGLQWEHVDLDNGVIVLAWQLQRMKKGWTPEAGEEARQCYGTLWWTRPKTKAGERIIPIYKLPPLWTALKALKQLDGHNPYGLVFHHLDGRPISPEDHNADWKVLLLEAGIPDAPLHAIRHTTTTLLRKAGVPADVRMMITGHSSAQAHDVYVHLDHEDTAAALGNLAALMPVDSL